MMRLVSFGCQIHPHTRESEIDLTIPVNIFASGKEKRAVERVSLVEGKIICRS